MFLVNELSISEDTLCPGICVKRWLRSVHLTPFSFFGTPVPHGGAASLKEQTHDMQGFHFLIRASTTGRREQSIWQHPGYHPFSQFQGPSSSPVLGFRGKSLTSDIYANPRQIYIGCKSCYSGRRWDGTLFKIPNLVIPQWPSRRLGAHCCVPREVAPEENTWNSLWLALGKQSLR